MRMRHLGKYWWMGGISTDRGEVLWVLHVSVCVCVVGVFLEEMVALSRSSLTK